MSDIIKLLPENVANQIAAGEVVQRPASIVKELLENSVDSGASKIILRIKDAGRLLIQVIDNGCGMTETDARVCFERHATSKISKAEDLFSLHTLGFRGEALSSIAAVTQMEMKTRTAAEDIGTKIVIEGNKIVSQEPCSCETGTSISAKNIFYNIPARRNFLKSNTIELKHVIEEFTKVALINPQLHFVVYNNENMLYDLPPENFKQRIVNLVNKSYKEKLIPIEAATDKIKISGYICKPEFAKKTKGAEQFFFVNNRYIRHQYLRHSIESAYKSLLTCEMFPMFFIKIEIDPELVDVNIHPTKTEVNFQDASTLYAILNSAVRKAFGAFSMRVPAMDFDADHAIENQNFDTNSPVVQPTVKVNPNYNPFDQLSSLPKKPVTDEWRKLYNDINSRFDSEFAIQKPTWQNDIINNNEDEVQQPKTSNNIELGDNFIQSRNKFIVGTISKGLIIIHQERAHERILFEEILSQLNSGNVAAQVDMFPETITMSYDEGLILDTNKSQFENIGFRYEKLGQSNYVINAHPANISIDEIKDFFESVLSNIKEEISQQSNNNNRNKLIAKATARKLCIKTGKTLKQEEMKTIAEKLAGCEISETDLSGKPTYAIIDLDTVENYF
ncbi:MAG: DNA mismatch repair endonuclease MutL [Bacteroidales bacterium]|jgi:DNA mismatch repair protein MutL|nr:DNA mismatch repair endonuclease MutL [Bacteroidales bacterium]MDD2204204.1 DNA mismatch repair endonuclease MutL [Bacteroidales bacterium]MDD3153003.1 DNA mismatch repair endonuclease MutL [Bacteroidales bacterium]MDD3913623.1 DNA mismatch repair endonuclease MutL [Bacteroidales bacterium]MDD4634732.1 DNA mismatch repair endonuclease MutL [Bacteroidales bacterium]